ncbi:MAG: helix-turn-helix domain-containing protein, partial [Oscillospiraceae bacterium]|nr:helix-turn-helix domain-containing protein [Oscillospiraceae bacterium]
MDAKSFGVFLAQQRKKQGFTQAELAEQLHVTDKAVSRWERGIGLPDINTLEPLANALQMTLDELIHAEIKQERSTASAVQAFVDLFSPQSQSVWRTIRSTCFILSVALC